MSHARPATLGTAKGRLQRIMGVLVTYRRPADLERSLTALAGQTRKLDELIVVDNEPTNESEDIVRAGGAAAVAVRYLGMDENTGFSGGLFAGMGALIEPADDEDWIAVLDDDDPPDDSEAFDRLARFAADMVANDPRTAAVGMRGARFDRRRGLLTRVATEAIGAAVPVDCIAGNALPMYRVGPLRRCGTFLGPLFFSHEELELGLRLQRAGFMLYADGAGWRERRTRRGRPDVVRPRRWEIMLPNWRSYYSLRNTIHILRADGRTGTALRISISRGLLKPLLHLPRAPRMATKALTLNARACADAWRGRLGRRVEPDVSQPRPKKPLPSARS